MADDDFIFELDGLYEFYHRWPDLRPRVEAIRAQPALSEADQVVLTWMIAVMDRIGPEDLPQSSSG